LIRDARAARSAGFERRGMDRHGVSKRLDE
jgi:hypothetical protein